ncbi:UDP-N-acetyl-D-glucosamine dehydrogenase [Natronoarchaeum philippinense]|uniref:UDP-N-acetyl-D-mannosamine dehydrogenase n=1 Tax=Natronoarchaeum philippinense TaxID=558529 RepID=A0A285P0W4_NATPI|nr:nucleotide sugar dehydrogenase [Natronoarchaeum philippinense]SNZ15369.1 UDP-N-acetyl-D-glucosamine dehydrogenase [Natronoarchaeum philippinense]
MNGVRDRIIRADATVAVVGLGYVGLPLACHFSEAGFDVVGFDIDLDRVEQLRDGTSYVEDIDDETVQQAIDQGFEPTTYANALEESDAFLVAVPTGVEQSEPDMSAVRKATKSVAENAPDREVLFVGCSTVYPGATEEIIRPTLRENGRRPGEDTLVAFAPERINPGGSYDFEEIPIVVGGDSDEERDAATTLLEAVVEETVPVESTGAAELTKVVENTYRMVNIALVNEVAKHAEEIGIDARGAIEAAGTKPFGFQAFSPGPGVGGHCIPVDPQFLTWQGRQDGRKLDLVEQAHAINESMPNHVVDSVETALAARGQSLDGSSLLVLGVSYKPNVGDVRNSPALDITNSLSSRGATTKLVDPQVDRVTIDGATIEPDNQIDPETVQEVDTVLLLVDHDTFEYETISGAELVVDTQAVIPDEFGGAVVRLGDGRTTEWRSEQVSTAPQTSSK